MAEDRDRNLVRETLEALMALNKKVNECARLDILVELNPEHAYGGNGLVVAYRADFTRTEMIMPA